MVKSDLHFEAKRCGMLEEEDREKEELSLALSFYELEWSLNEREGEKRF